MNAGRAPKDHPILFSAPMIQALIAGRKIQTRRMEKRPRLINVKAGDRLWVRETWQFFDRYESRPECFKGPLDPKSLPEHCGNGDAPSGEALLAYWNRRLIYRADAPFKHIDDPIPWRPSIFLPRWASRIALEATEDARPEPLQDISEADSIAEGISPLFTREDIYNGGDPPHYRAELDISPMPWTNYLWHGFVGRSITQKQSDAHQHQYSSYARPRDSFFSLWDSLHAKDAPVSSNPVPVRLAFRVLP